jgi:hypothetical protein
MNRSDNHNGVQCSQKGKGIKSACIKHIGAVIYQVNYFKHKAILFQKNIETSPERKAHFCVIRF